MHRQGPQAGLRRACVSQIVAADLSNRRRPENVDVDDEASWPVAHPIASAAARPALDGMHGGLLCLVPIDGGRHCSVLHVVAKRVEEGEFRLDAESTLSGSGSIQCASSPPQLY